MISKEERAELRLELSDAGLGFPLPWRLGEDADIVDADGDGVADCMVDNSFTGCSAERYIVAAANAAPTLIDALDAADERIAGLEAEVAEAGRRFTSSVAKVVREYVGKEAELKARITELEAAAQSTIFALQPTWAQDPASLPATLGRAIVAHQESLQALAKGCDYVASQTDGYDRCVADPMVALGLLAIVETDEDGDTTYKRVRPAPIPALPEGGA